MEKLKRLHQVYAANNSEFPFKAVHSQTRATHTFLSVDLPEGCFVDDAGAGYQINGGGDGVWFGQSMTPRQDALDDFEGMVKDEFAKLLNKGRDFLSDNL